MNIKVVFMRQKKITNRLSKCCKWDYITLWEGKQLFNICRNCGEKDRRVGRLFDIKNGLDKVDLFLDK